MSPVPRQKEFFARPTPPPGTVFVNDRVCVQTEEEQRVVFVHGIIFSHYPIEDRTAEAYAMVALFETGYADQNDIARCFGYSARTLRRYQERLKAGDRHRGSGCPLTPATPPCVRVRTRRFEMVTLTRILQIRETERFKIGRGKRDG